MNIRLNENNDHLKAYWKLDELDGDIIHDFSGNNHDGYLYGGYEWIKK